MQGSDRMQSTLDAVRSGTWDGKELSLALGLEEFPREILDLAHLEVLDLSGNRLKSLPSDFPRLKNLKILFLSGNEFKVVPEVLGECQNLEMVGFKSNRISHLPAEALPQSLRWLILTDNRLRALPERLGTCTRLQKLMLAGNCLESVPDSFARLGRLELLRLSANALDRLPAWIWELPRLSWLAVSGNPACPARSEESSTGVPWDALALHEVLGEGASGVISRARHNEDDVAVKVFKGRVTSDGWPHDEMTACLAAGRHPNLVGVRARVEGHPEGREALLLDLIPSGYSNLGAPPSRESCTRDVFASGRNLSASAVRRMAAGIGSLLSHLHARDIAHGDLYAHNILVDRYGHALLGDFGAASFLSGLSRGEQDGFRRIEARAYGCLLDDLLGLAWGEPGLDDLVALRDHCLSETPADRPSTAELGRIPAATGT
jgi:hypothetical protein